MMNLEQRVVTTRPEKNLKTKIQAWLPAKAAKR